MSESIRESLSALMDGESNELELQRVLSGLDKDESLRETWLRYHTVRSAAAGERVGSPSLEFSDGLREVLAAEKNGKLSGGIERLLKPLASFAVAASVAAVVVVGGQQLAQLGEDGLARKSVASSYSPVGVINSVGAIPIRAGFGAAQVPTLQPAASTAYKELARQRMHRYMQEHAELAALNSPQGLVPYARVQNIRE